MSEYEPKVGDLVTYPGGGCVLAHVIKTVRSPSGWFVVVLVGEKKIGCLAKELHLVKRP